MFHLIRQSILVCAAKSVDLLHVNKHFLASFVLWVSSLFAEAGFGVWEMSRQHAVLQVHEMGGTGRCPCTKWEIGLYIHLFCFRPSSLKYIKTGISFFLVVFLVRCNQDFYFIITMHMISSVLRIRYIIASCVDSARYIEITMRLGIKCFQYSLFQSNTLFPLAKSKSLSWLTQRWASLGAISLGHQLSGTS